ncbi:hypothetical protein ACFQ0B_58650 [Nonomuraea thailandensis]
MRKRLALLLAVLMSVLWQMPTPASAALPERNGLRGDYYLASAAGKFDFAELKASIIDPNLELADLNPTFKLLTGRRTTSPSDGRDRSRPDTPRPTPSP